MRQCFLGVGVVEIVSIPGVSLYPVPKYARLTTDIVVDAEPVASHPELMRVQGFGAFENGALVRNWELVLTDEEIEALLNEG